MYRVWAAVTLAVSATIAPAQPTTTATAAPETLRPDQATFRGLYEELVNTNTTLSSGSCTLAAQRMAARLKAAGYTDADLTLFSVPDHPKEGGLVAVLPGRDPKARAILLLAHLDVVEAKREDWTRDPFKLVEENGYFYARGASDDKAMAAIFTDTMARMHSEPRPRRTVKMALTCGEETTGAFNGAEWLSENKRDLIDADFALNEGGGGRVDKDGKRLALVMQVSEKIYQDFTLEVTNPGGHSSLPRPDNAIYELAAALGRIQAYAFPVRVDDTTRAFWTETAKIASPAAAEAMNAIARNPDDKLAAQLLSRDPLFNANLRTTCVPTLITGGHAQNALPQRATANVNCRIFPGETIEGTRAKLEELVADPAVKITLKSRHGPIGHPAPLRAAVVDPARKVGAKMFPGLPLIPAMSTGASDSIFLAAVGIPSYGVPGILYEADGGGIHGLNEHIRVRSLYEGRDYLHRLIRLYAEAP
ncbi:MAG: M20/M25/M40 family metallo-hydrolase [Sphingomonas sp.]